MVAGCIHEYPYAVKDPHHPDNPSGNNPNLWKAGITVEYNLEWETLIHNLDNAYFSTKASSNPLHRFIIEVKENGNVLCRDIRYATDEEFSEGRLMHTLSAALENHLYELAVWYDNLDDNKQSLFLTESLENIKMDVMSTYWERTQACGFSYDILDLRDLKGGEDEQTVTKKLQMGHPVARFEIIATDIQQFISDNKEALEQGDSFTMNLLLSAGAYSKFNIYQNKPFKDEEALEMTGRIRLPFAEYDELKIAEGFFFCPEEENEATAKINVTNSALFSVSHTDYFTFPVKRGYVTCIKGDFLTHPVDGIFTVDNIWAGEIEYIWQE